jgi:hypothetical protein
VVRIAATLPDEPTADDHDPACPGRTVPERTGVGQGAQRQHSGQVCARDAEHQVVPAQFPATRQPYPPQPAIDVGDLLAGEQLDAVAGVEVVGAEPQLSVAGRPEKERLGQRRALVRRLVLLTDDHHAALVALLPEGSRDLGSGLAGADDDRGVHRCSGPTARPGCPVHR